MADYNLKDDLLGFGRSQLKYMLFHNTTLAELIDFTHKKGLFYYDTTLDSVEFIKDNTTGWHSVVSSISSNNPAYVADNDLEDRLVVGSKLYAEITGFNPGVAGFITIDADGYPLSQAKITFEDILSSDYTTTITAPGVDTRFATEKAIVDYVAAATFSAQDNILDWDGTKYLPYDAKKSSDPLYAYFYTGNSIPTYANNRLNLDGTLYTRGVGAYSNTTTFSRLESAGNVVLSDMGNTFTIQTNYNETIFYTLRSGTKTPIYIGQSSTLTGDGLVIDMENTLFNIDVTTVRLNKGTANKYLYLDASKNITYVDAPSGGVTPIDNILDWDTNAYKPYTSKTASAFYTGVTVPDAVATILNYDGIFRATQLFEGGTRVMTTHGNWTANGSLHAVTTTAHAGFCPQLPASATGLFLRDDGAWGSIFWKRSGTTLSPFTTNDKIYVEVTGVNVAITGNSAANIGVLGSSTTSNGLQGTSSSGYGIVASSTSSRAGRFLILPSSTNTIVSAIELLRQTQGTAANGIGCGIDFYNENSTGNNKLTSTIASVVTDVTAASETASIEFWTVLSGTLTKQMELTGAGQLIVPTLKVGTSSNYTEIEADGTIKFAGDATVWDDLRAPASGINPAGSPSPATISTTDGSLIFAKGNVATAWFQFPHGYKEGSDITIHIHWAKTTSAAGNVNWQIKYKWVNIGDTEPAFTSLLSGSEAVPNSDTANKHALYDWTPVSGTGKTISSMLCVYLQRTNDGSDTYATNAKLYEIDVHYEMDGIGSREITTK